MRALLLLLLLPASLLAQAPAHYRSETHCEAGHALSAAPLTGSSSRDSTETMAHEAVHRRQLAAGCDSIMALWSRDLGAKMNAEAEALCVGMRAAGVGDVERRRRAVQAAQWWSQWAGGWSFAEYLTVFQAWCVP